MRFDNSKLLIAATAATLILPQFVSPFLGRKDDFAKTENRNITPFPREFKWRKLAEQLEEYYNDRVPFRRWTVRQARMTHRRLFPQQSEMVIIGKNGFLFLTLPGQRTCPYRQYIGKYLDPITHYDRKKMLDYMRKVQRHAEKNNARFLMVSMPSKIDIYPDMLPEKRRFRQQGFLGEELMFAARSSKPEINFLYLKPALVEYRKKMPCPIYFAQDTHWNVAGAYCGMKTILDRLGLEWPKTWPLPEEAKPRRNNNTAGNNDDLRAKAPLGTPYLNESDYFIAIPAEGIKTTVVNGSYFISENPNAFDQREVVVFRDSFFNALWYYFAAYFRKVHFVSGDYIGGIVENVKPQLVICGRVARVLPIYNRKKLR